MVEEAVSTNSKKDWRVAAMVVKRERDVPSEWRLEWLECQQQD